jgi:hypothetical protein
MTTRTGEPATKRESYTAYIQGRAAKVSSRPETPTAASVHHTAARLPRPKNKLRTPHAANLAAGARPTCDSPPPFTPFFQQEMPDIDALDRENPLAVTEYVNDIFSYWFRVEVRRPTSHRFVRRARRRWLSCRRLF